MTEMVHSSGRAGDARLLAIWRWALAGAALALLLLNLPFAPRTWFDEGSHLHVPKTIVQDGVYADKSAEGYRYHGPTIGIGPTIMLPVALAFKLGGVGIMQGRLVIVVYGLIGLLACYALARRLYGPVAGLLAVTLLLASRTLSYEGWVEYSRQVLGEVPGMAFFFGGLLAWWLALQAEQAHRADPSAATQRARWQLAALAGLGLGLTLVTKNQFALIIPPTLALAALLDWRYYRAGSWVLRLVPPIVMAGCFGVWVLAQFQFLGPGTFLENMQSTRQAAGGAIFVFSLNSTLRAGRYILQPDLYGGLLLPALAYTLWRARQRTPAGLAEALLGALVTLWLAWFVFVSLGWPRYAYPAVALSALLVARLAVAAYGWLRATSRPRAAPLAGAYLALALALPLVRTGQVILAPDNSAERFAAVMRERVPPDAIVATWDPELGVLTDHRYSYPPQLLLDAAVRAQWLGAPPPSYDWSADQPPYLALGPFGAYSGIYSTIELERDYTQVAQVGEYYLYQRR